MNQFFKVITFFVLSFLTSQTLYGQDKYLDSLQNQLKTLTSDTAKVNLMNKINSYFLMQNPTIVLEQGKQTILLAQKNKYPLGELVASRYVGIAYVMVSKHDSAGEYLQNALAISRKIGNKRLEASCLGTIGNFYTDLFKKKEALESYLSALKIAESIKDKKEEASLLCNIGSLYQKDNNIKQAEDCFRRAIQLTEGTNFFRILQMAYLNLGVVYDSRSDFANANLYYQKANELTLKTHDKVGQVKILHNLGKIHLDLDKYEVAYTYFTQALTNAKEIGNNELEIISLLGVAESESKLGNNQLALKYALEAEKIIPTNQTNLIKGEVYEALFNIYQLMGNVHKALDYHILYKEAQDSIFNANKSAQMSEIQTKYEVEKKETENTLLKKEKDLKDARIRQQMWIIVSSLIIIGLVVFLSIMLYRSRQKEKGINAILADQKIELESKNRLLEELNAVKDRLFSIISHDLRAPLGSLKSLLTLLNDKTLSEAQVTALFPKLSQDVGYTSDLLDSLLHWAKSQLHGIHTNPKKIDMKALVEENISLLSSIAEQKNIELTNEIGENVIVLADEDMTRTILRNLVSNALKFTKANGHIRVSAQTLREGLEVTVEDTGVGMSQEVLSQLFKGNITKRGTKNEKGTGLGLILVKDFLEKNGGTIRVESEVGKGSKFIFTLPLAEVAAAVIS